MSDTRFPMFNESHAAQRQRSAPLRTRRRGLLATSALVLGLTVPLSAADQPGGKSVNLPHGEPGLIPAARSIFDGKTLDGWKPIGGGKWTVADQAIIGQTGDGKYGWLIYEKPVADFILEFECRLDDHGNTGIQFRSHVLGDDMCGYQADLDPDNEKVGGTGGIYDEGPGGRAWLSKPDTQKVKSIQKPMGQWNDYKIQAIGDHLQTWLNGQKISDIYDHQLRSGIIALQVHSGKTPPVHVSFRKIRLADLGDGSGWKSLFNGKDLDGWHTQGEKNVWTVEDGQIVGELVKPSPYAYLATDRKLDDFELKIDMKFDSDQGNSGVFFRCSFPPQCTKCNEVARNLPEDVADFKCPKAGCGSTGCKPMKDRVHIHGPQCEFAPAKDTGSPTAAVYDARGHGWVNVKQVTDHMKKMNREKDWNELRLLAHGNHIIAWLNGYLVSDITDYDFPKEGIIALQMHETKNPIKVRFRNIQIRPLK